MTHNYYRARHGSPPLVLSSVLTDEAQYWAERLLVTGAMEGLDNSRIGISVAVLDKGQVSGVKVKHSVLRMEREKESACKRLSRGISKYNLALLETKTFCFTFLPFFSKTVVRNTLKQDF